jgi:hypothetical protein
LVHDAERGVAVLEVVDDDAQRAHVVDLENSTPFLRILFQML